NLTNNGTALLGNYCVAAPTCASDTQATWVLSGVIGSTGSTATATITVSFDGGPETVVGYISDWHHDGRDKEAAFSVNATGPIGTQRMELCFTQPGSDGRQSKQLCANTASSTPANAPPLLAVAPLGDQTMIPGMVL